MSPTRDHNEEDLDDLSWEAREALDDPDGPQPSDLANQDEDETPTVRCPSCGADVPEFADRCPYCGDWIVQGGRTSTSNRGLLFAAVVVVLILALLWWLI